MLKNEMPGAPTARCARNVHKLACACKPPRKRRRSKYLGRSSPVWFVRGLFCVCNDCGRVAHVGGKDGRLRAHRVRRRGLWCSNRGSRSWHVADVVLCFASRDEIDKFGVRKAA